MTAFTEFHLLNIPYCNFPFVQNRQTETGSTLVVCGAWREQRGANQDQD